MRPADRCVPDPNVFRSSNKSCQRGCKGARLGVVNATSGLDPCKIQGNLRAVIPFRREAGEDRDTKELRTRSLR